MRARVTAEVSPTLRAPLPNGPIRSSLVPIQGRARLWGLHRKIVRLTSAMPFAGRELTRLLARGCITAHNPADKAKRASMFAAEMAVSAPFHYIQLRRGLAETTAHAEMFMQHPTLWSGLVATLDLAYATANGAVLYTHGDISRRVARSLWNRRTSPHRPASP